jgi:serine/threonine protein kinase
MSESEYLIPLVQGAVIAERYRIEHRLGGRDPRGGIFAAHDTQGGTLVVLEVAAPPETARAAAVARLAIAARVGNRLGRDAGYVRVFDRGEVEPGGRLFLTMDLIDGAAELDLAAGSIEERLARFTKAATLVAGAHAQGVILRDLSPASFLEAPDGSLWLGSFGSAKESGRADDPAAADLSWTRDMAFAAPERLEGGSGDERSDVYSLGAMLALALGAAAPAALDELRARAVATDPGKRPESARELLELFEAARGEVPAPAKAAPANPAAPKPAAKPAPPTTAPPRPEPLPSEERPAKPVMSFESSVEKAPLPETEPGESSSARRALPGGTEQREGVSFGSSSERPAVADKRKQGMSFESSSDRPAIADKRKQGRSFESSSDERAISNRRPMSFDSSVDSVPIDKRKSAISFDSSVEKAGFDAEPRRAAPSDPARRGQSGPLAAELRGQSGPLDAIRRGIPSEPATRPQAFLLDVIPVQGLGGAPPPEGSFEPVLAWERYLIERRFPGGKIVSRVHPVRRVSDPEAAASDMDLAQEILRELNPGPDRIYRSFGVHRAGAWAIVIRCLPAALPDEANYQSWGTGHEADGALWSSPCTVDRVEFIHALATLGAADWLASGQLVPVYKEALEALGRLQESKMVKGPPIPEAACKECGLGTFHQLLAHLARGDKPEELPTMHFRFPGREVHVTPQSLESDFECPNCAGHTATLRFAVSWDPEPADLVALLAREKRSESRSVHLPAPPAPTLAAEPAAPASLRPPLPLPPAAPRATEFSRPAALEPLPDQPTREISLATLAVIVVGAILLIFLLFSL